MTAHDADEVIGAMQHYRTREGRVLKLARRKLAHSYSDELYPPRQPIEPIITSWREAGVILLQAGLLLVSFVAIAWTIPIFAEAMGL